MNSRPDTSYKMCQQCRSFIPRSMINQHTMICGVTAMKPEQQHGQPIQSPRQASKTPSTQRIRHPSGPYTPPPSSSSSTTSATAVGFGSMCQLCKRAVGDEARHVIAEHMDQYRFHCKTHLFRTNDESEFTDHRLKSVECEPVDRLLMDHDYFLMAQANRRLCFGSDEGRERTVNEGRPKPVRITPPQFQPQPVIEMAEDINLESPPMSGARKAKVTAMQRLSAPATMGLRQDSPGPSNTIRSPAANRSKLMRGLKCNQCRQTVKNSMDLTYHAMNHEHERDPNVNLSYCPESGCDFNAKVAQAVIKHLRDVHPESNLAPVRGEQILGEGFYQKAKERYFGAQSAQKLNPSLQIHKTPTAVSKNNFKCSECGEEVPTQPAKPHAQIYHAMMHEHERDPSINVSYCPESGCDFNARAKQSVAKHLREEHPDSGLTPVRGTEILGAGYFEKARKRYFGASAASAQPLKTSAPKGSPAAAAGSRSRRSLGTGARMKCRTCGAAEIQFREGVGMLYHAIREHAPADFGLSTKYCSECDFNSTNDLILHKHGQKEHRIDAMAPVPVWNKFADRREEMRDLVAECFSEDWVAKMVEALDNGGQMESTDEERANIQWTSEEDSEDSVDPRHEGDSRTKAKKRRRTSVPVGIPGPTVRLDCQKCGCVVRFRDGLGLLFHALREHATAGLVLGTKYCSECEFSSTNDLALEKHGGKEHAIDGMTPVSAWHKFPDRRDEMRQLAVECFTEDWAAKMAEALGTFDVNDDEDREIQLPPEDQADEAEGPVDSKEGILRIIFQDQVPDLNRAAESE